MGAKWNKWKHYQVMKEEEALLNYLPETQLLTEQSLWELMNKYNHVIIKPRQGVLGRGITQVSFIGKDLYEIHAENRKITLTSREEVYNNLNDLKKLLHYKPYIVQQKIPLATIDDCPFDLRVMVQRKKNSATWVVTGKLAKVAAKGFFITNVAQNILPVEEAIQHSSLCQIHLQIQDLLSHIDRSALLAATQLETFYPKYRTIGFDIGLDQKGKVWIIEANFKSMISMFDLLKDKTMYQTIKSYEEG
ncbi:YheC/YheD family protein [Bacillus songklensis]|uniref:YheC/YheD family protein n=1 Tax=Bacillus songklensis TaxID=1069116 RepID=A0ABV8B788_9BACI